MVKMSSNDESGPIHLDWAQERRNFTYNLFKPLAMTYETYVFMVKNDTLWELYLGAGLFGIVFICFSYASSVILAVESIHVFEDLLELLKTYNALWFMLIHFVFPLCIASSIFCTLRFYITLLLSFPLSKLSYKTELIHEDDMADEKFQYPLQKYVSNALNSLFSDIGQCTLIILGGCFFSWIPLFDYFVYGLFLVVQIYASSRPFVEIVCMRQGMTSRDMNEFRMSNRVLLFGLGLTFCLNFFFLPVIGWYAAPSLAIIILTKILQDKKGTKKINPV